MFGDLEYGARQEAFRARLADSGVTTATVTSPGELETALLHALTELPRPTSSCHGGRDAARGAAGVDDPGPGARSSPAARSCWPSWRRRCASGGPAVVQAVTGMGGVGKTTTAIEYAHRHRDEFDIAWWVPAEDPALIPDRLAELARALDLAGRDDPAGVGVARLLGELARPGAVAGGVRQRRGPAARCARFLPEGPGPGADHLPEPGLARDRRPGGGARVRPGRVGRAAAHARPPASASADADRVAEAVGDLPLAVEQAGVAAGRHRPGRRHLPAAAGRAGRRAARPRRRAAPIRCRWPRRGRWRSTGSPPTTRPRWTC